MARLAQPADTIAAIATAAGRGGIGIVRVSGPDVARVAAGVLGALPPPRKATVFGFHSADGCVIDRGIALHFPGPCSYTGEDVLELQGHGGPVVLRMVLAACLGSGARLAEPGEFTKRAFLNGKLDLAQAESVADLIEASTEAAVRSACRSLSGAFSEGIHGVVEKLVELRTFVEATLDFPDEEVDFLEAHNAAGRLASLRDQLISLLDRARQGALLRGGLHVVLAGRPNVGKSSLLNRFAGEERAIVTEIAGTTRDALRETVQIEGIPLHIIDTAGLRDAADQVERMGISRTWREIESADVVVLMCDARVGITAAEREIWTRLPHAVETLTVMNKIDLAGSAAGRGTGELGVTISLSAKTGEGMGILQIELLRVAGWHPGGEDSFVARERHIRAIVAAQEHLALAFEQRGHLELLAEELRLAQETLGEITGEFTADDLLGAIFSRFCLGK